MKQGRTLGVAPKHRDRELFRTLSHWDEVVQSPEQLTLVGPPLPDPHQRRPLGITHKAAEMPRAIPNRLPPLLACELNDSKQEHAGPDQDGTQSEHESLDTWSNGQPDQRASFGSLDDLPVKRDPSPWQHRHVCWVVEAELKR